MVCVAEEEPFVYHVIPLGLVQRALEREGLLAQWAQEMVTR